MSADKSSKKQTPAPSHQKKGSVINRRYNRTVSQDHARSTPKWAAVDGTAGRVLKSTGPGTVHYIRRSKADNRWESMPARDMYLYMTAPQDTKPEVSEEKAA